MAYASQYDPDDDVWSLTEARIRCDEHARQLFIPFCVDLESSSNALRLDPEFRSKDGYLQRHAQPCQWHAATGTALGVTPSKWQRQTYVQLTRDHLGFSLEGDKVVGPAALARAGGRTPPHTTPSRWCTPSLF